MAMKQFRFVGTVAEIGPLTLDRFGKGYEIEETFALTAIRGGAALIPEEDFQEIGFSSQQLKIWADPFMPLFEIPTDPEEAADKMDYLQKREAAQQRYREIRQGLLEKPAIVVVTSSQPEDQE